MASRRPHLGCGLFAARISQNHLLFLGCASARNRRKQGPFWLRNPFNVLLKIALPDVGHISTVFGLRRPRKAASDGEPKKQKARVHFLILWKASVLVTAVINAKRYCFVFCGLCGEKLGISGKGSNSAARREGHTIGT